MDIASAAGISVLEIEPASFGHGRTRNLGAQRTSGELVRFLTQDATPVPGCLAAHRESHALARELTEFFAGFPDGLDGSAFLSNVNASYKRACWEELGFDDVAYSEDQAFARAMRAAGHRLGERLRPARRRAARPRLPADHLHAPLLRRVPRPARHSGAARRAPRRATSTDRAWRR